MPPRVRPRSGGSGGWIGDGSKMQEHITTSLRQILKYLKPEITAQPQAQTVYADTNASFPLPPKESTSLTNGKRME